MLRDLPWDLCSCEAIDTQAEHRFATPLHLLRKFKLINTNIDDFHSFTVGLIFLHFISSHVAITVSFLVQFPKWLILSECVICDIRSKQLRRLLFDRCRTGHAFRRHVAHQELSTLAVRPDPSLPQPGSGGRWLGATRCHQQRQGSSGEIHSRRGRI